MRMINVLKESDQIDWNILLIGFELDWCTREDIIEYAEVCIAQTKTEVDLDLIRLIFDNPPNRFDLIDIVKRLSSKAGLPTVDDVIDIYDIDESHNAHDIIKKYQYASLSILLKSSYSSEKKVELLQDIYADFGYPENMRACSIYGQGGMPLLSAAQKLVSQLEKEYIKK